MPAQNIKSPATVSRSQRIFICFKNSQNCFKKIARLWAGKAAKSAPFSPTEKLLKVIQ